MKLAFCLFRYYPFGGLERDFLRIATEAMHRGHEVVVYTMAWEGEVPPGIKLTLIPVKKISNHSRCLEFNRQLQHHLQQKQFDLVIGFNRMAGLDVYYAADLCYVANARRKHGFCYRLLPRYRTYAALERAVFSKAVHTEILLLSAPEQKRFQQFYATPDHRFHLLPPGIDRQRITNNTQARTVLRNEFNIGEQDNLLLMVGSDFKRKGVDRALLAVAALPASIRDRTFLFIIGNGKNQPLIKLAKKLNIQHQLRFLGARTDVGSFLQAADLLLHPAYQETAGMALLEALVAGLPVLVTENCGYAFHIEQANAGMIVPMPFKQQTLNECLHEMLLSEKQETWRENARHYASTVDLYSLPQRAVDLFEEFKGVKS